MKKFSHTAALLPDGTHGKQRKVYKTPEFGASRPTSALKAKLAPYQNQVVRLYPRKNSSSQLLYVHSILNTVVQSCTVGLQVPYVLNL